MTFYREGKKCNYYEVIEILSTLISKEILKNLDEEEVNRLFIRIMDFTDEIITNYLNKLNYRVLNLEQAVLTLHQIRIITKQQVWQQAIKLNKEIKNKTSEHSEVIDFMSTYLLEAMKELNSNLTQ